MIVFSTQDVIRTLPHWESWCTRLGPKENRVKARIVPRDPAQAQALRAGIGPELLHSEARVLGVNFRQAGGLGISAQKRCDQGLRILGRVACAPVSFVKKEVLASTRVTALMCWGVWFEGYPQAEGLLPSLRELLERMPTVLGIFGKCCPGLGLIRTFMPLWLASAHWHGASASGGVMVLCIQEVSGRFACSAPCRV